MYHRTLIFVSLFLQYSLCCYADSHDLNYQERLFKHELVSTATFTNETRVICYVEQNPVGFISYTKIPLLPYYAIHSFYVYRYYRQQGHGEALLTHACKTIKQNGGKRVYIQPGPFEMQDNNTMVAIDNSALYEQQLQNLLKFYQKRGFEYVYTCTALSAQLLYKLMGIPENAQYLMVKTLN